MDMREHPIANVVRRISETDGTFDLWGDPARMPGGFMVHGIAAPLVNPDEVTLVQWVFAIRRKFHPSDAIYLTRWTDPEGNVRYDLSELLYVRSEAVELAQERGEITIWSWDDAGTVYIGRNQA